MVPRVIAELHTSGYALPMVSAITVITNAHAKSVAPYRLSTCVSKMSTRAAATAAGIANLRASNGSGHVSRLKDS
eukprot:360469-Chlamydomonas_euryale.AAC.4